MNDIKNQIVLMKTVFDEFICNGKVGIGRNFRIKEILKSEYYKNAYKNAIPIVLNYNDEWQKFIEKEKVFIKKMRKLIYEV